MPKNDKEYLAPRYREEIRKKKKRTPNSLYFAAVALLLGLGAFFYFRHTQQEPISEEIEERTSINEDGEAQSAPDYAQKHFMELQKGLKLPISRNQAWKDKVADPTPTNKGIAIIFYNGSMDQQATKNCLLSPYHYTVAFSPYGNNILPLLKTAHKHKKSCLVDLPVEPLEDTNINIGPLGLWASATEKENAQRLAKALATEGLTIGVLNKEPIYNLQHYQTVLKPIIRTLWNNGGLYVQSGLAYERIYQYVFSKLKLNYITATLDLGTMPMGEWPTMLKETLEHYNKHSSVLILAPLTQNAYTYINTWVKNNKAVQKDLVPFYKLVK